jgi:hypothetical protein
MNLKHFGLLAVSVLLIAAASPAGQTLRGGDAAIYMKSGDLLVDRINDISSARFVLETANNGEIPLRDIWMINFVNEKWDFPDERALLETSDHYVFLKNGSVSTGRIVDFSSDRRRGVPDRTDPADLLRQNPPPKPGGSIEAESSTDSTADASTLAGRIRRRV